MFSFFKSIPEIKGEPEVQPISCLKTLDLTQKTQLCLNTCKDSSDYEECKQIFLSLEPAEQDHVFPLLPYVLREQVKQTLNQDRVGQLTHQHKCYKEQLFRAEDNPNTVQGFFFTMTAFNAEKYRSGNKITYIVPAEILLRFSLKPYKYQRKLIDTHVQRIADGIALSKMMYHPIIIAYEKEKDQISIMDGQHRWNALHKLDAELLHSLPVQVDVIVFNDEVDEEIVKQYRNINTTVPIDPNRLQEELRYVRLVDKLKEEFPSIINGSTLSSKKDLPPHFVVDAFLKEELQIRQVLENKTEEQIITCFKTINKTLLDNSNFLDKLSQLERRACVKNNLALGIQWPASCDLIEGKEVKIYGISFKLRQP
jgi:hypothetical protein